MYNNTYLKIFFFLFLNTFKRYKEKWNSKNGPCHNFFSLKNQCTRYAYIYIKGSLWKYHDPKPILRPKEGFNVQQRSIYNNREKHFSKSRFHELYIIWYLKQVSSYNVYSPSSSGESRTNTCSQNRYDQKYRQKS